MTYKGFIGCTSTDVLRPSSHPLNPKPWLKDTDDENVKAAGRIKKAWDGEVLDVKMEASEVAGFNSNTDEMIESAMSILKQQLVQ